MIKFKTEQGEYTSPRKGDYVLAENMPTQDKHEAVVDAFEKCGCVHTYCADWGGVDSDGAEWDRVLSTSSLLTGLPCATWAVNSINCERRIIPVFEEKKPLIEALKPGMRAKINPHGLEDMIVEHRNGAIMVVDDSNPDRYVSNISYLTTTDYEIIEGKPGVWGPSGGDYGWQVDFMFEAFSLEGTKFKSALRTKKSAEHKAKLDRVYTEILNSDGYGEGDGEWAIYWNPRYNLFIAVCRASNIIRELSEGSEQ